MPSSSPLPVFMCSGTVREVRHEHVAGRDPEPAEYGPDGKITRQARDGYDAYDVVHTTLLTDLGGFGTVTMRAATLEEAYDGVVPNRGDRVEWPVWVSMEWYGPIDRRRTRPRYTVPHDVAVTLSREAAGKTGAKGPALSAAASA